MKLLAALLLTSCYAAHAAEPCYDGGEAVPEATTQAHGQGAATAGETASTYPGPCPFEYDSAHCWCVSPTHEVCDGKYCEGPYVGCIAPGSPVSSTWEGRP